MKHQEDPAPDTDSINSALPGGWLFYFIAIAGSLISLLFWYASVLQTNANLEHTLQLQSQNVTDDIKIQLELRISALKHMAKHLHQEPKPSFKNWQDNVVEFINDYGGFAAVAFLGPDLNVRWLSPHTSNIAHLYTNFVNQYEGKIHHIPRIWVSPAAVITEGEKGVFMVEPINTADGSMGYLAGIINIKDTLRLGIDHNDYAVTIYDNQQTIYQDDNAVLSNTIAPGTATLDIYGTIWHVVVKPTAHLSSTLRSGLPPVALILGICIAVLFAIASHLAQLARQRAKSLNTMNSDLKNEIIEHTESEASKQKLEKALLQGQKLQAIGTLAGGIAHDFNNILYAIMGYAEMSREDVAKDSLTYNNLGKVLQASQRGQELIARILAFSRRQHHILEPIAIKSTIENVLALLVPTIAASARIDFVVNIDDNFTILGDQTQLHQVIVNIVNNAVDAMDEEGVVLINLSQVPAGDELLQQFPDVQQSNYCKIDISDTGYGMDQSVVARIFEPFFTTKEVGKGTGLGLATAHTIVKEHHGQILVKSQLGEGTCFTILLPEYKP